MRRIIGFWALEGGLLLGALVTPAPAAQAQPTDARPSDSPTLQAALEALTRHPDGPVGVIVTIDDGRSVRVASAGEALLGTQDTPQPEDHVRVASLAKAMTGAALLSLVDEGVLELTDTVGEWLPELPAAWHPVTLRQLLSHTSGLPEFGPTFADAVVASPTEADPPGEIVALAGDELENPPGSRYAYSNVNPFVTGLIIEAATDAALADVLNERVFEPLDMLDTYLPGPDDPGVAEPTLHGYEQSPDGLEDVTDVVSFGGWAWASGGVVSTSADLTKFVQGYVGGELFGPALRAVQRDSMQPGNSDPRGPGTNLAGLALFRYDTRCGSVFGHTGSVLGYTQFIGASDDGSRSVAFTISTQFSEDLLPALRAAEERAVCLALGKR
jgi:D-alanyl-D-alanine carboxypeptidase